MIEGWRYMYIHVRLNGWMDELWMDTGWYIDQWLDGWMDGWIDENGCIDGSIHV